MLLNDLDETLRCDLFYKDAFFFCLVHRRDLGRFCDFSGPSARIWLIAKNNQGTITKRERAELERLVDKAEQGQRGLNDWHSETVSSNRDIPEAERSPHREVGSLLPKADTPRPSRFIGVRW